MRHGFLRSSRYSPGNMDRESLEALFVGRVDDMEDVLSRVTKSIRNAAKHYVLLVGPRGSGKTHFLALAYHRLMDRIDAADARDSVAVAMLNEEEWGVASFLDLVVRILRALANQAPNLDAEIAEIYDRFSKDPADAEGFAAERLRHHTRGKTLLLLCENLVDLFHGLGEEGQKRWRAAIQEDGNWAIVASTPSLFSAVTLQDNPFYGFFTIRALEKIDFDTGLDLLARKAVHEGKTDLAGFLRTPLGRARARAIHHLAAGNHRAYVVLFDFLDKESLEDLVGPFMHMVDDLTPYYQDRMRQLPPAQRKIVEFLCLQGRPVTIKDISTPCLMSHQTAAKQIGELRTAGFVSRTRFGRNTFCELSEPLMRICIEVKDNKTQHFRLFVEFLRHWFTTRELEQRHAAFYHDERGAYLDRVHVEEAVRCSLADGHEPLVEALQDEAMHCWDVGDYEGLATIQETLARDTGSADDYGAWVFALVEVGDAQGAIAAGREAVAQCLDDASLQYWLTHAYFDEERFAEALSAIDQAIALEGERPSYLCIRGDVLLGLERFEEAIRDAQAVLDAEPDHWHSFEQMLDAAVALGRPEDAEVYVRGAGAACTHQAASVARRVRVPPVPGQAGSGPGTHRQGAGNRHRQPAGTPSARPRSLRHVGATTERTKSCGRSLPGSRIPYRPTCRLSDSLLFSGEWEEAIDVAERLIEIDPAHSHAHLVRGRALIELGRPAGAVAALDGAPAHRRLPLVAVRRLAGPQYWRLRVGWQVP